MYLFIVGVFITSTACMTSQEELEWCVVFRISEIDDLDLDVRCPAWGDLQCLVTTTESIIAGFKPAATQHSTHMTAKSNTGDKWQPTGQMQLKTRHKLTFCLCLQVSYGFKLYWFCPCKLVQAAKLNLLLQPRVTLLSQQHVCFAPFLRWRRFDEFGFTSSLLGVRLYC